MKEKIKKRIKNMITDNNMLFSANLAFLLTGITFFIFTIIAAKINNMNASNIFTYISAFYFASWVIFIGHPDSIMSFIKELARLMIFLSLLIFSVYNCLISALNYEPVPIIIAILSSISLFVCFIYFVSRITIIFTFIKKLIKKIKKKIFNSSENANTKFKALIENVTAFLVSIGGLTVAVKVITESIFQILDYFK